MRCNKNPAQIKITKINKGQFIELALCQECAAEESPFQKKIMEQQNLSALLTNLLKNKLGKEAAGPVDPAAEEPNITCPTCGHTLDELKETFLIGCPDCYKTFESYMTRLLRKIHGNIQHMGKMPPGFLPELEPLTEYESSSAVAVSAAENDTEPGAIDELLEDDPLNLADDLAELHRQLKKATDGDDFLRAAQIRDEIKALEKNLSTD